MSNKDTAVGEFIDAVAWFRVIPLRHKRITQTVFIHGNG